MPSQQFVSLWLSFPPGTQVKSATKIIVGKVHCRPAATSSHHMQACCESMLN